MIEEIGTTEKPDWLDLPEKDHYWACSCKRSKTRFGRKANGPRVWRCLFYTKEDAEAFAYTKLNDPHYPWDGKPARPVNLADAMLRVRQDGDPGVTVESWQGGQWVTVKKYPAEEPLPHLDGSDG